jgi:D-alanine-D-alanine ligase
MLNSINSSLKWFLDRVALAESLTERIGVLLVANVQGRTYPSDDYEEDSIISEFLTAAELDYLIEGFEKAGIYCETVIDEQGFLDWLDKKRKNFPKPLPLVYNLAQNGTGPARLSLIPGLCRLFGLPIVDSDAYGVAIARHKFHYMVLLRQLRLPAVRSWWFTRQGWYPEEPPFGVRLIAKPTFESASIGIHKDSVFEMYIGVNKLLESRAAQYRQPLVIQEFIRGFEIEVPVFDADGAQTIGAVGLAVNEKRNLNERFLTYDEVAFNQYSFYDFAAEFPAATTKALTAARKAFQGLGLKGVGRIDFRVQPNGSPVIIEVACKPHLTKHSSFTFILDQIGKSNIDLLKFIIGSAIERYDFESSHATRIEYR